MHGRTPDVQCLAVEWDDDGFVPLGPITSWDAVLGRRGTARIRRLREVRFAGFTDLCEVDVVEDWLGSRRATTRYLVGPVRPAGASTSSEISGLGGDVKPPHHSSAHCKEGSELNHRAADEPAQCLGHDPGHVTPGVDNDWPDDDTTRPMPVTGVKGAGELS